MIDYTELENTMVEGCPNSNELASYTISVYNNQSTKLLSVQRSGKSFTVPLTKIPDGTYILEVSSSNVSYREILIIKRS